MEFIESTKKDFRLWLLYLGALGLCFPFAEIQCGTEHTIIMSSFELIKSIPACILMYTSIINLLFVSLAYKHNMVEGLYYIFSAMTVYTVWNSYMLVSLYAKRTFGFDYSYIKCIPQSGFWLMILCSIGVLICTLMHPENIPDVGIELPDILRIKPSNEDDTENH